MPKYKYKINIDGNFVTKEVDELLVPYLIKKYPNAELISETPPTENFQNGDAETDASVTPQVESASSGDYVLEDTSSESSSNRASRYTGKTSIDPRAGRRAQDNTRVKQNFRVVPETPKPVEEVIEDTKDYTQALEEQKVAEEPFTPYYFTFEESKGLTEDELVAKMYDRLASVGLTVDATSTYNDLDAIQLTKGAEEDLGLDDLLLSPNPFTRARAARKLPLRGMDFDEFFGGDNIAAVGEDVTDEQLKLNIQKLNNFIFQNADLNYIKKARENVGVGFANDYVEATKAEDLSEDKQKSGYMEDLVDKFEGIEINTFDANYGVTPATINDFANKKEFEKYKIWKAGGVIPEVDDSTLAAWNINRKQKEVNKKSGQYISNLTPEERLDYTALAFDESRAIANLSTTINNFTNDVDAFDIAIEKYKANPTQEEYVSLQNQQLELLDKQGRVQSMQDKAEKIGLLDRAETIPLAIADLKKNYNRMTQLNLGFSSLGQTISFAALTLSSYVGQNQYAILPGVDYVSLTEINEQLDAEIGSTSLSQSLAAKTANNQTAIDVDEIRNATDVGSWLMNSTINLAPSLSMAATGPLALPLFFASGAGGVLEGSAITKKEAASRMLLNKKWLDSNPDADPLEIAIRQSEMDKDSKALNIADWRVLTNAALTGAAEVFFERVGTMTILKNLGKGVKQLPTETLLQGIYTGSKGLVKGSFREGGSELATTIVQNFGEIYLMDEDKNFFDAITDREGLFKGGLESFAQGGFMGGGMTSLNSIKAVAAGLQSEVATQKQQAAMRDIVNKISKLTGVDIQNINNLSELNLELPANVQKEIDKLVKEGVEIEQDILDAFKGGLSTEQILELGEINRKKRLISKKLTQAAYQGLSASKLTAYKDQLKSDFDKLDKQRETLLGPQLKGRAAKNKLSFDLTQGYNAYRTQMLVGSSLEQIAQKYAELNSKDKQKGYDEARAELKALDKKFTDADVKALAAQKFQTAEFRAKIEAGKANAIAFAEEMGLDVDIITVESKEDIIAAFEKIGEGDRLDQPAEKGGTQTLRQAIESGVVEGMAVSGTNKIIIDINKAAENGRSGIYAHEVLHKYALENYNNSTDVQAAVDKAGKDLLDFIQKTDKNLYAKIKFRLDESYEGSENYYEEAMNAMSDIFADGFKPTPPLLIRIKAFVNAFLSGANGKDTEYFKTGKEAYFFVRDFNKAAHFGQKYNKKPKPAAISFEANADVTDGTRDKLSRSRKLTEAEENRMEAIDAEIDEISDDLMQGFIDQDTHDRKIDKLEEELENIENPPKTAAAKPKPKPKAKKELDIDAPQASKKDEQSLSDVTAKSKKKLDAIGNNPDGFNPNEGAIYEVLAGMIRSKVKAFKTAGNNIVNLTNLPGFEMDNMVSETIASLIPYIKKFDPAKNDSLFGYTMAQLGNRMRGALKTGRVTENTFTEDVTAAKGIIAEDSSNEVKEKPKYRKLIEAGVVGGEVIDAIRAKLKSTLRTLKTRLDAPISNNRTVTPLIAEIQFEMGKQADIDLKTAMGGKKDGKLKKFLLRTKKATLQNMTTTWLMGKDGQGGIPQAIQKQLKENGKWVSYPAWVGKEIAREKTSTDDAGRTSGALLVRRHPNIVNYKNVDEIIDNDTYLAQFLDETGNPIRGRKEALAKAMGEEISFEIFSADLADPASDISEAFENNQERQEAVIAENFIEKIERDIDRGNIKFSKGVTPQRGRELAIQFRGSTGFGTATARKNFQSDFLSKLNQEEKVWANENLVTPINLAISKYIKKDWQSKEKIVVDLINKLAGAMPGLSIIQKGVQKDSFKPDLAFQVDGENVNWEIKGGKTARIATVYISKWFDTAKTYVGRSAVPSDFGNTLVEKIKENKELKKIVDIIKKSFETNTYVDKNGNTKKLDPKDRIIKDEGENLGYKMPSWYYHEIIQPLLLGAEQKFVVEGGLDIASTLYNSKDVNYITFADLGNFVMGPDYLGTGLPELKGDAEVRIKARSNYSGEGKFVTLNMVAELQVTNISANALGDKSSSNMFNEESAIATIDKILNTKLSITKQTAIDNTASIKYSQTPKGISVFDFDDTLARTKSNVLYVMPDGTKGKLTAAQFAARSETMLDQGAEFDFSEFSKVMKGELGPLFSEAQKKEGKYTNKDIFVLTARPANSAKAIHEFLKSEGLNIPIENITGLGNGSPQAKADWMVGKIANGYNDFYFADDHIGNVKAVGKALKGKGVKGQTELSIVDFKNQPKAVRDILNTFDVKGPTQRSRVKFSRSSNKNFNDMLERASGIKSRKRLTQVEGRQLGKNKGRFKIWMPSSLEDFRGLTEYTFAGKGRQGEADQKFFQDALVTPYWRGINEMDQVKQSLKNGFAALNKKFKPVLKKLGKKIPGMVHTHDQALRVYLWNKAGYEIPGLTRKQERELVRYVQNDAELLAYAKGALQMSQRKEWSKPSDYWDVQTILSDINNFTEKAGRKEYLKEFIDNADLIFSEANLNKVEAIYGKDHRDAIEDILYRMKNGTNRAAGMKKNEKAWNNWLNNSIGAIMFFNRRSALLQTLSTVNFVNWSDNNPMKAAAAFANQKQFWSDFAMIFNSAKLKQRRSGLKTDVNAAELASAVTGATDKASAALNYLLKIGFIPTQMVDSFAIASGGATFYRNRLNTYLKEKGADGEPKYTQKEAEKQAFEDFSKISDETQQSGDPALISSDQSSSLGRVVLNFMNTPIQLNRSIKKSAQDIYNRRRTPGMSQAQSDFSNFSKIIYYGAIQNAIFSSLQAAMFALIPGFNDDEEEEGDLTMQEKTDKKLFQVINSMVDTTLKGGFGLPGAVVSILKNAIIEYKKQEDRGFLADDSKTLIALLNISPAVGSKGRKVVNFIKTERFDKEVISERGWDVTVDGRFNLSPRWSAAGNLVEGVLNIPTARVVDELNSITEALDSRNTAWQRIALALGWKTWNVGSKNEENDLIEVRIKSENKERKKEENKEKRKQKKLLEEMEEKDRRDRLSQDDRDLEDWEKRQRRKIKSRNTRAKNKKTKDSIAQVKSDALIAAIAKKRKEKANKNK